MALRFYGAHPISRGAGGVVGGGGGANVPTVHERADVGGGALLPELGGAIFVEICINFAYTLVPLASMLATCIFPLRHLVAWQPTDHRP